jgi:hypothetical protein
MIVKNDEMDAADGVMDGVDIRIRLIPFDTSHFKSPYKFRRGEYAALLQSGSFERHEEEIIADSDGDHGECDGDCSCDDDDDQDKSSAG